jgi:hypothetical protein
MKIINFLHDVWTTFNGLLNLFREFICKFFLRRIKNLTKKSHNEDSHSEVNGERDHLTLKLNSQSMKWNILWYLDGWKLDDSKESAYKYWHRWLWDFHILFYSFWSQHSHHWLISFILIRPFGLRSFHQINICKALSQSQQKKTYISFLFCGSIWYSRVTRDVVIRHFK